MRQLIAGLGTMVVLVASMVGVAHAAPLGITLQPVPDITVSFVTVQYSANALSASGFATEVNDDGVTPKPIAGGTFDLTAAIDSAGALSTGPLSTFTLTGTVAGLPGSPSGLLLSGDLTGLGFPDTGPGTLEFTFRVSGGALAPLYGGVAALGGVLLHENGFTGSWATFATSFTSSADIGRRAVPVPPSLVLLAAGVALQAVRTTRARRHRLTS